MSRSLLICLMMTFALEVSSQKPWPKISEGLDVTVIIFLAVDCPISQKYIPALSAIHKKYNSPAVRIQSVIPGKIKKKDIEKFKEEYRIPFNVFADSRYELVKRLSAQATPEVFVLDNRRKIRYRGAIDNWFYELGGYRKEATEVYLTDAIEALLRGDELRIEKTKALGCSIQMPPR
jgi:hypothetical protein